METEEERPTLTGRVDYVEYLKAVQINLDLLEQRNLVSSFIKRHFLKEEMTLSMTTTSLNLKRETLIMLLLDLSLHGRNWQ